MSDPLLLLLEKDRIIDTINQLFVSTDRRDWPAVRRCFADQVLFDVTSMTGGKPTPMTPEQISAAWEQGLRPIESIHHQAGNYRVDIHGEQANASCYGIALHYRATRSDRNTRTFVGSYDFHFLRLEGRWRIDSFRFNLKFLDGNLTLEQTE